MNLDAGRIKIGHEEREGGLTPPPSGLETGRTRTYKRSEVGGGLLCLVLHLGLEIRERAPCLFSVLASVFVGDGPLPCYGTGLARLPAGVVVSCGVGVGVRYVKLL